MKINKNYVYTLSEIKDNLTCYHKDVISNDVLQAIKDCIVQDNGAISRDNLIVAIDDHARLLPVNFENQYDLCYNIKTFPGILIPEVIQDLENNVEFTVTIVDGCKTFCVVHSADINL